jgi:magnesium-transporting ATPase (P-type)
MLTGDKGETAEEIGYSCGLFLRENFNVFKIEDHETEELYNKLHEISKVDDGNYGFMISGSLLPLIFGSKDESTIFLKIIRKAKAVIVYRSSPA